LPVKLVISCIGYKTVIYEIFERKSDHLNIELKPETTDLEPVSIFDDKVYTRFRQDGITSLREIDLKSGALINNITIPEFVHIENIRINNNIIYFLYKEKINQEYKQLYRMAIMDYL